MSDPSHYKKWVTLAAWLATGTALILLILKLYAWLVTDAAAMLATATDSLLDLFASLMNLIILRFALQPADDEHKFGHGKAESLAGLVQSAFVMGSAVLLIINGIERIVNPVVIVQANVAIWVTIITIVMTLLLVLVQKMVIRRTQSVAISADSLHYQSDLLLNFGVLLAIILSQDYWLRADGFFTMLVGGYLLYGAVKIAWISIQHLMDHELPEEDTDIIKKIIAEHPEALGIHDLRTRQSGNIKFIQFHLELPDQLSLKKAHDIGDKVEEKIVKKLSPCDVFIHQDPKSVVKSD
ncbi:MAG: cation diffusion facilitator family transporter [Thalassotalea sp.]